MTGHKHSARKILGVILFLSLTVSILYAGVRLILAPEVAPAGSEHVKVKSDYLLMVTQCLLGLIVMTLPSLISRKWKLEIPHFVYLLYYLFLYCSVFLGEVFEFYYVIPHWDTMLHFFSGGMLGALGFILVDLLNREQKVSVHLSSLFVCIFAFCFALAAGAIWEIYEYTCDTLLKLNMQKYATEQGVALMGRAALNDTMKDILFDALAALIVSVLGYFSITKKHHRKTEEE